MYEISYSFNKRVLLRKKFRVRLNAVSASHSTRRDLGFKDWGLHVQGSRIYGVKVEGLTGSGARDSIPSYSFLSGRYLKAVKGVHALISDIPLHYEDFEAFGGLRLRLWAFGWFRVQWQPRPRLNRLRRKAVGGRVCSLGIFSLIGLPF